MKELFPLNPITEILNVDNEAKKILLFTPLKKKENEKLSDALRRYMIFPKKSVKRDELDNTLERIHRFGFKDIIAIGDTNIETRSANNYIENIHLKINDLPRRSFKCFVNKDWKNPTNRMNLPYHDDGGCSWNCLMKKLKNPEYGVIFSISEDKLKKFNIA